MRVLITGMGGFAGRHLLQLLLEKTHWNIIGIGRSAQGNRNSPRVQWWKLDLADADGVARLLKHERPDIVVHLAGQSHVPTSWERPWETFEINVRGQLHLFQAVIAAKLSPRILVVTSNEVYGAPENENALPFRETRLLRPNNPYAVSKVAADSMALQYRLSHGLDVVVARPFNHSGPGQSERFVLPSFAKQIAEIEAGKQQAVIKVGNMTARRDYTDVRDVAAAYFSLIQHGEPGEAYNVCSGTAQSIQALFELMVSRSRSKISTEQDPSKFRQVDTPISFGDNAKIHAATGWQPSVAIGQTVQDMLDEWRERVKN